MVLIVSSAPPTEGIIATASATKAFLEDRELGVGTLYITEEKLLWRLGEVLGDTSTLALQYQRISAHAVQRDPIACLYLLVDYDINSEETEENGDNSDNDDNFDPVESHVSQVRFIPENPNCLQELYDAMSRGQQLHPDPCDIMSDDDEQEDDIFEEDAEDEFEEAEDDFERADELMKDLSVKNGRSEVNGHSGSNGGVNGHLDADDQI